MKDSTRRVVRRALAPKAVVFGTCAFNFGWALSEALQAFETAAGQEELFVTFTLFVASACLAAKSRFGDLSAAFLCAPLPLLHVFFFWASAGRIDAMLLSDAHLRYWLGRLAETEARLWLVTAASFVILFLAAASALRPPAGVRA